ncbi:MAG: helix-turn-helix transcriptional regulator [Silvanigrellales bacterium]|nr:helix-turn-helix transcriptional regulator [Silvanigrellales bacterium]
MQGSFFANVFLCGALFALALLLAATGAALRRESSAGLPVLGGGVGLAASALTPLASWGISNAALHFPLWPLQISLFLESLVPAFFWFGAEALFRDDFEWKPRHALGLVAVLLSLTNVLSLPQSGTELHSDDPFSRGVVLLFKGLNLGFVGMGLLATLAGWRADLVPSRLKVRFGVVVAGGAGLLVFVALDAYEIDRRTLDSTLLFALNLALGAVLLVALAFLAKNRDLLSPWPALRVFAKTPSSPLKEPKTGLNDTPHPSLAGMPPDSLAEKLRLSMEEAQIFRKEGLTIAELAGLLKVPEYRLRTHINSDLGYRNFNQFLAHSRIELAKRLLLAPGSRHDKVLSIALDVGYASLAPFNRAFREATGLSPSAFREQAKESSPLDS